jgi:integrase
MALTFFDIKAITPKEKSFKLSDGDGLYLLVQPNGNKFWRFRYRYAGIEKMLALGPFPAVSIAEARVRRDAARKRLIEGVDPSVQKKLDRIAAETAARNTFGLVAEEFIENLEANGAAAATMAKNRWLLQDLAAPLANRPIAEITAAEILDLLKRIEKSGRRETARRLRGIMGAVFRLAVVTLRAPSDPTYALQGALLRANPKPRAAITDERKFGALLRAIDDFDGWPTIRAALKFAALTFARPGEVRGRVAEKFRSRNRRGAFLPSERRHASRTTFRSRAKRLR